MFLGAYPWGGQLLLNPGLTGFRDTVAQMVKRGFTTIRVAMTPDVATLAGYGIATPAGANRNLAWVAAQMLVGSCWEGVERVMITAHDFTTYDAGGGNGGYVNAAVQNANKAAINSEYQNLFQVARALLPGRQIIPSNWEGDNQAYSGSAYAFATNPSFAAAAKASWPVGQSNAQRVAGLLNWFGIKDEAVAAYKLANPGADVIHAPEFNVSTLFDTGCNGHCTATDSVVQQIGLAGGREYASFSSYDAQGDSYIAKLDAIAGYGIDKLIIGETGVDFKTQPESAVRANFRRLVRARRYGDRTGNVVGIIVWNAVNPANDSQRYGLLDVNGNEQVFGLMGEIRPAVAA